jgi:transposase
VKNNIATTTDSNRSHFSSWWSSIQRSLFPQITEELGPLPPSLLKVIRILDFVRIETYFKTTPWPVPGRPKKDRIAIARAFCVKAILNLPTTRALIDRLNVDTQLRRICGMERKKDIPSESVLSRSFQEFSNGELPQRVHDDLIKATMKDHLVGHISRDSTAIEAREVPQKKEQQAAKETKKTRKKGRPKKDEQRAAPEPKRLVKQAGQTLEQMLGDLPQACSFGVKRNSAGFANTWIGYKIHLDVGDGQIPISAILTSASVHDSQVAIPLATLSAQRVTSLYDLMDAAYDCPEIYAHSKLLGHVPIIDKNPRRDLALKEELAAERKRQRLIGFQDPTKIRYNERTTAERVNGRLKDEFGGRNVRVRGGKKVACHLFFGIIALTADQLMRLVM